MKKCARGLKVFSGFVFLTFVMASPVYAVLQSGNRENNEEPSASEIVPSTDRSSAGDNASDTQDPTPKATVKMKLRPRSSVSKLPAESGATSGTSGYGPKDDSIFKSNNPHQVRPDFVSPFIRQVGSNAAGYKRQPVLNYGKARGGSPGGSKFTVKQKTDPAK